MFHNRVTYIVFHHTAAKQGGSIVKWVGFVSFLKAGVIFAASQSLGKSPDNMGWVYNI